MLNRLLPTESELAQQSRKTTSDAGAVADVILVSSLFGVPKIAEPIGISLLAGSLRAQGISVKILEPSVDGWSVDETIERVARIPARIVGVSMLRDKHVEDVVDFTAKLRAQCPDRFVVVGGHGPSIAVSAIPVGTPAPDEVVASPDTSERVARNVGRRRSSVVEMVPARPIVDPSMTDRGKGPADLGTDGSAELPRERPTKAVRNKLLVVLPEPACSSGVVNGPSPYFDKSLEYMTILKQSDAYLLAEADQSFPELAKRVLAGEDWRDVPGVAYFDQTSRLIRKPPLPKVADLDAVPFMARDTYVQYRDRYGLNVPASLLFSRGCFYTCTFCSVVKYEALQEGRNHRQRSSKNIVAEIDDLHRHFNTSSFNFEDDNFIINSRAGRRRLHELCDLIIGLGYPVTFTFFCRADAVNEDLFRHFVQAGLCGIYFGVESVFEEDLHFFDKGLSVSDIYRALDVLKELGFSAAVDAEMRLMLGYITWHPLTSFDSLEASLNFVRQYQAPPKLLRRKLRLYSGTDVLADTARLGLLDPDHRDGWVYREPLLEGLDDWVNSFFVRINRLRDAIRTLEKAQSSHGFEVDSGVELTDTRRWLDGLLLDYFGALMSVCREAGVSGKSPVVREFHEAQVVNADMAIASRGIRDLVVYGYRQCGFPLEAADLFRK